MSDFVEDKNTVILDHKEIIKKVYLSNDKPWILGYSGGKDSTATMHLVISALKELRKEELKNHLYIISSDTLVETPLIINEITRTLDLIDQMAKECDLPISTHRVSPMIHDTFWVNMIGRGYPCPNQSFRWCTDRMKINPTNKFITDKVSEFGEVIVVLGVRSGESNSRDRVMQNRSINQSYLMKHGTLRNAYVFPAIKNFTIDDVWNLLLNDPSPWNGDNSYLFQLYSESNGDNECPLIIDEETKSSAGSCGNSRFGCWVCTVVSEDKSLTGFIKSGHTWLKELLDFRNWLISIRDDRSKRMKMRINGEIYFLKAKEIGENTIVIPAKNKRSKVTIHIDKNNMAIDQDEKEWKVFYSKQTAIEYIKTNKIDLNSAYDPKFIVKENDEYFILGTGGFTLDTRKEILMKLLLTEQKLRIKSGDHNMELIGRDELKEIQKKWFSLGIWKQDVADIYFSVYGVYPVGLTMKESILDPTSLEKLEKLCNHYDVEFVTMKKLIALENDNYGLIRRTSIHKEIKKILDQNYLNTQEGSK